MNSFSIKPLFFSIVIFTVGILSTYILSIKIKNQFTTQSTLKVENIAKQTSIRFQDALNKSFNDLKSLQAFYSANKQHFSEDEFDQYMDVINLNERHYIQALSWVPLVKHKNREYFEKLIKEQQPTFNITERDPEGNLILTNNKDYYTPVTYIRPYEQNKSAQGFDLNSNSIRRASLELARDSGKITTTAKIRLVQEQSDSAGFLIIAPVYKQGLAIKNKQDRIEAIIGYVTGVFRIDTLMHKAKEQADQEGLILTLLDINKDNGGLLYGQLNNNKTFSFDLTIPDRHWQLDISLNNELLESIESPFIIYWISVVGILVSLLLSITLYALQISIIRSQSITRLSNELQNQNNKLEIKVEKRTKKIANKNSQLNRKVDELNTQRIVLSELMKESEVAKTNAEQRAIDLARSNKDLDAFAYVASHDLKAPLRGIDQLARWVAEDIEEGNLTEVPEYVSLMRSRVQRLETLLNDLLDYSRANRQENSLALIDTEHMINELFVLVSPPEKFNLTIQGVLPIFTTVKSPFEQVIRNLLNNAIKHHHKDNGHIKVSYIELDDFYQFSIEDDGPGIESDYYDDIFKMFKTLKPRDVTEGSGMGLALIKKVVEYYSGQIKVESRVGQGSTFVFTWPKILKE